MSQNKNEGGFISHLTELRSRLINSFICLFLFFIVFYFFSENLYNFLVKPYAEAVKSSGLERRLIFTALQETFLTYLKVSFFAAFFLTSPFILIQIQVMKNFRISIIFTMSNFGCIKCCQI